MTGCLVLSHGGLAQAIIEASQRIVGECDQLFCIECANLAPPEVHNEIVRLIEDQHLADGLIILVGLRGGSYWQAAARIAHQYEFVEVISGFNLATILSFVTKRNQYPFADLVDVLAQDAIRGVTRLVKHKKVESN